MNATNVAVSENENRIGRTIEFSATAPTIYPDVEVTTDLYDVDGTTVIGQNTEYFFNELNYKFWYDTNRLELLVLYKDESNNAYSYVPVSLPLTNIDLDVLNTQVQANSYANNQQEQAIQALEGLIFDRATIEYVDQQDDRLQMQINLNTQSIINNSQEIDTITDDVIKQNDDGIKVVRHGETSFYAPDPLDLIITYRKLGFEQSKNPNGDNQLHFVKFAAMVVDRKTGINYVGQEKNELDKYGNNNEYCSLAAPRIIGNSVVFATGQHTDGNSFQAVRSSNADPDKPWVIEAYNDGKISKHKGRIRWSVALDDKRILYLGHPLDGCRPGEAPASTNNPLANDGPNQEQIVCLLDTDDLINDVPYETFDRVDVNGDPHVGLKAYTKLIADDIGGAPAVINRGRAGEQGVYIVQAGRNIKRVVIGDLDNKEVTLEDETAAPLTFEYITNNGGVRKAYKGKVNGLTAYENRYLVWHSFAEGVMCFDTVTKVLTNLYATPENIAYGVNELNSISPSAPQLFGSLYFVPESSEDWSGSNVSPKVIIVNSDLSTDTVAIPTSAYAKAGKWHCTNSERTSNNEFLCTNLGYYAYKFNAVDNRWVEYEISDTWGAGGVFRVNGVNTITPVAYYDGPGHSWAYKDSYYMELVNGLNPEIIANSNWDFLFPDLEEQYYENTNYTPYDNNNTAYPLTLVKKDVGWTGNGAAGQFWFDNPARPFHVGFKGGNQAHVNAFPVGVRVKIEHTNGVLYATVAGSWYSGQVHLNLEGWVGDILVEGEEVTQISYGEYLPQFVRTDGGTMSGDLVLNSDAMLQLETEVLDGGGNQIVLQSKDTDGKLNYQLYFKHATKAGETATLAEYEILNSTHSAWMFRGSGKICMQIADDESILRSPLNMQDNKINKLGDATANNEAVNLGQLIDDTVYGQWKTDNISSLTSPSRGSAVYLKNAGAAAAKFGEVTLIRFNYQNDSNVPVDIDTWNVGEVIKIKQIADDTVTAAFRISAPVQVSGDTRTVPVEFAKATNDENVFGNFGELYEITLRKLRVPV